jgi:hypothetical protein
MLVMDPGGLDKGNRLSTFGHGRVDRERGSPDNGGSRSAFAQIGDPGHRFFSTHCWDVLLK